MSCSGVSETPVDTFELQFERFRAALCAAGEPRLEMRWEDRLECADDPAGNRFDRHYVYHSAWAARVLASTRPARHVDISSCIYFSAIASAFVPVDFYEFRQTDLKLDNLNTRTADLTGLPFADGSV